MCVCVFAVTLTSQIKLRKPVCMCVGLGIVPLNAQ